MVQPETYEVAASSSPEWWYTLTTLFAFGTFWFWLLVLGINIALYVTTKYEKGFVSTLILIGSLLLLQFVSGVRILDYIQEHPYWTAVWVLGYFSIAPVYGFAKWLLFSSGVREIYEETRRQFLRSKSLSPEGPIPDELKFEFSSLLYQAYPPIQVDPQAADHKARIIRWMTWWPWSLLCTLFDDFLSKIFSRMYYLISGWLQQASDKLWKSRRGEFLTHAEWQVERSNQQRR